MADSSPSPTFNSILEYIQLILRYIASGFVGIGVYIYLFGPNIAEFKDQPWVLTFITVTIGFIIYALHFATLDKIFYGYCLMRFIRNNKYKDADNNEKYYLPEVLKEQIIAWEEARAGKGKFKEEDIFKDMGSSFSANHTIKRHVFFAMANQAYLRHISKNSEFSAMQTQVEKRAALLNFLYCSSYQIILIVGYYLFSNATFNSDIMLDNWGKIFALVMAAVLIIICAVRFNLRICSREMWLIENFPQRKASAPSEAPVQQQAAPAGTCYLVTPVKKEETK